jgi:hypothetical protein
MGEGLGAGLAGEAIIFANVLLGLPFMVLVWYLGRRNPVENSERKFNEARILFTCSILLNSVWIISAFLPEPEGEQFVRLLAETKMEVWVSLIGFVCLCASVLVGHGSRGPGTSQP